MNKVTAESLMGKLADNKFIIRMTTLMNMDPSVRSENVMIQMKISDFPFNVVINRFYRAKTRKT